MEIIKTQAKVSCNNDKSNLRITLYLDADECQRLLVEGLRGQPQPEGMFEVVIKNK